MNLIPLMVQVTAAEYVPIPNRKIPDVQWKRQMRFLLKISSGEILFSDALYRDQDKTEEELLVLCTPKLEKIPAEDRFCKLSIITADSFCRVYLDDRLIWGCCPAFYGGHFEMRHKTDNVLKVEHFFRLQCRNRPVGRKASIPIETAESSASAETGDKLTRYRIYVRNRRRGR